MSDIAVIYKSHYGFAEAYARLIAGDLSADLLKAEKVRSADLQRYSVIICGGGLYAGKANGLSLLTKNFESLNGKALYFFTVGAADVTDAENVASIRASLARALSPAMLKQIKIYHLRGGILYSKMGFLHRMMMGMLHRMLLKKPENEIRSEDRAFLDTYGQDVNFVDKKAIGPLVEAVRKDGKRAEKRALEYEDR